jgi:glutamate dehydrogenase
LRERFREEIHEHRLHREITATHVANSMVNRCGITFAYRLAEETGATASEIARAYTAAREIFGTRDLWSEIESLDNRVDAEVQTRMMLDARKLVERASRWLLRNRRSPLDIEAAISHFAEGATQLSERIPDLMIDGEREAAVRATERLTEAGVPAELARRVAILGPMFSALDIVDVSASTRSYLEDTAAVYFTLGDRLKLHWLRGHVEALPRDNRWRTLARSALRDDLYGQQAVLTAEILRNTPDDREAHERIETWIEANRESVDRSLQVLSDINASGTFDLSTLSVALREIRNLITTSEDSSAEAEATTR